MMPRSAYLALLHVRHRVSRYSLFSSRLAALKTSLNTISSAIQEMEAADVAFRNKVITDIDNALLYLSAPSSDLSPLPPILSDFNGSSEVLDEPSQIVRK